MNRVLRSIESKFVDRADAASTCRAWRDAGHSIVFTNGCFDLLHFGHLHLLTNAASHGDKLVVALNNDDSVRALKGAGRPVINQEHRALLIAGFGCVSLVCLFHEATPLELIKLLEPNVLVKGGDYREDEVVGANEVRARGGKVALVPYLTGLSSSNIVNKSAGLSKLGD